MRTYRRMLAEVADLGTADLRRLGREVGGAVAARRPDLVEELEGIATGAAQRLDELLAVNARTELLAGGAGGGGGGECTVVGRLRGDRVVLAQNWDWHPDLLGARVAWTVTAPGDGPAFTTVTEAGLLGKLGVSAAGVAVGLNFLTCSADGGVGGRVGGIPIHVLLRMVLDRCEGVLDALNLLMAAPVTASSAVTVATAEPALVAVELSPGGARAVLPDPDGLLVHANHFAVAPPAGVDTQPAEHPGTLLRAWKAAQLVRADGASVEAALAAHFPAPEGVCRHHDPTRHRCRPDGASGLAAVPWADQRATLLSIVMDPGAPSLRLAPGPPCETAYAPVALPWAAAPAPA